MRSIIRITFVAVFLLACEERVELALSPEDTGLLVVEGVLTNERKNHLIKLSLPYPDVNGEPSPATGASVFIVADSLYALTEFPSGSGRYYTPVGRAVFGTTYTLAIQYNGKLYFAQDSAVPVQPLQELKYTSSNDGYSLIPDERGDDPYYIEHLITWRHTEACLPDASCEGIIFSYNLQTIDVNEITKPNKAPFFFPHHAVVVRRKYSVSSAYRAFLRSMLSETEWRGGVFDVQRANVVTNLSEGAVGFFAVCSVVADTTVVE